MGKSGSPEESLKTMSRYRKLTTICCAAVFALGLAACGGGSSGPTADQQAAIDEVETLRMQIAALAEKLGVEPENVGDGVDALRAEVDRLQGIETDQMEANKEAARKAMAAKGKALYGKLNPRSTIAVTDGKINITAEDATGTALSTQPTGLTGLAKQDTAVAALGNWKGADYMRSTGTGAAKVTATARVYSNTAAPKAVLFEHRSNPSGLTAPTSGNAYTIDGANLTSNSRIAGPSFPTAGTRTYSQDERKFAGTYRGASGTYSCTAGDCTAAPGSTGGITLVGTWTFTPAPSATVQMADTRYLQFGWWLREAATGPTHASVFYRMVAPSTDTTSTTGVGGALTGSAKYAGKAAGKFAINNPLGNDSDAGHFTANAMLNAKFGATTDANTNGVTGMIDGFRLNDGSTDPGWSLSLKRARWDGTNLYSLGVNPVGSADTADDGLISGAAVEWSIGGTAAPGQTGSWRAQLFDDNANDGSTAPTVAGGTFEAGFGGTHKIVGAFGAEKQ